jgi:hypothetical protein
MYTFLPCCPDGRVANSCARRVYEQGVEGIYRTLLTPILR